VLGIILTVFLLLTVKILFIFAKNIKTNKVINKSILKQISSGKLSFLIIMLFFAISFSLVGGAQILNTLGSRSIETQFNNYNLYQNQTKGRIFSLDDYIQDYASKYYNDLSSKDNKQNINKNDLFINP